MKIGNSPCVVIIGIPYSSSVASLALRVAEVKEEIGEEVSLEDQTRYNLIVVRTDETPKVEGILNICQHYSLASATIFISTGQFETLESGNIIVVNNTLLVIEIVISKCAIFLFPR